MDNGINRTLSLLAELLRAGGVKARSVEAVEVRRSEGGREAVEEVAEITYRGGRTERAAIGGRSNLEAAYAVLAVVLGKEPGAPADGGARRGTHEEGRGRAAGKYHDLAVKHAGGTKPAYWLEEWMQGWDDARAAVLEAAGRKGKGAWR